MRREIKMRKKRETHTCEKRDKDEKRERYMWRDQDEKKERQTCEEK